MVTMVNRVLALALLAASVMSTDPLWGQFTVESSVRTAIVDSAEYTRVGDLLLVPENEKVTTARVGLLLLSNIDGYSISIKASNATREPVPLTKEGDGAYSIRDVNGKVWVDGFAINWEAQSLEPIQALLDLGGTPDVPNPPDPPAPDDSVPEDEFDNIGRQVNSWATGLPGRKLVAGAYKTAAKSLLTDLSKTTDDVGAELKTTLTGLPDFVAYRSFFLSLDKDLGGRWPLARGVLSDYYTAVAAGLEAGQ